ncbi:MAG: hypothetical protein ACERKU_08435 [Nitrospirota bacterium]
MVTDAERHGKLIGDFAPHGPGLGESQVMRLGGCAATNEAGLGGNHFEVIPVTNPLWLGKSNTSGVDLQTMWAHFLMPIDVIVSG